MGQESNPKASPSGQAPENIKVTQNSFFLKTLIKTLSQAKLGTTKLTTAALELGIEKWRGLLKVKSLQLRRVREREKAKETATKYQRYGPSSLSRTRVGAQAAELTDHILNVFMQAHLSAQDLVLEERLPPR